MLDYLLAFLKDNGYGFECKLNAIPHSCCVDSEVLTLDFDRVKEEFTNKIGNKGCYLKSVDAIFFANGQNELLFIEMKRFDDKGEMKAEDYVDYHLKLESVPNKVIDSINIILGICGYHSADAKIYSYLFDTTRLRIKPFLLVNLSARNYLRLVMTGYSSRKISLTKRIDEDFRVVNCKTFSHYISSLPN